VGAFAHARFSAHLLVVETDMVFPARHKISFSNKTGPERAAVLKRGWAVWMEMSYPVAAGGGLALTIPVMLTGTIAILISFFCLAAFRWSGLSLSGYFTFFLCSRTRVAKTHPERQILFNGLIFRQVCVLPVFSRNTFFPRSVPDRYQSGGTPCQKIC
jgi:hypothetical protein